MSANPALLYGTPEFRAARYRRMAAHYSTMPPRRWVTDEPEDSVPFDSIKAADEHYKKIRTRFYPVAQAVRSQPQPKKAERRTKEYPSAFGPWKPQPKVYPSAFGPPSPFEIANAVGGVLLGVLFDEENRDVVSYPKVRIVDVIGATSRHYSVSVLDIMSHGRTANVVKPRQVAMYLAKTLTPRSLPEIGRRFGGRDHTTILHSVRKITGLLATDETLAADVNAICEQLGRPEQRP